jgi:hypothetical protein
MFRHLQEEPRWNADRRACSDEHAAASVRCGRLDTRLSAFRFPFFRSSVRHCERSEAIQCSGAETSAAETGTSAALDCFVASLLAMTGNDSRRESVTAFASAPAKAGEGRRRPLAAVL